MAKRGKYKSNLRGYDAYVQLYKAAEAKMNARGYHMRDKILSKEEWKTTYEAEKNDRLAAVQRGERKTTGDINRQLVKEATYTYTQKQAKGYQQYLASRGQKVKLADIRGGKIAIDWDLLKQRRDTLHSLGIADFEIDKLISQEFFGSE